MDQDIKPEDEGEGSGGQGRSKEADSVTLIPALNMVSAVVVLINALATGFISITLK